MAYVIKFRNNRYGQRVWKTKAKAMLHMRGIMKNNTLKQRQMTGMIRMRLVKYNPNQREMMELKRAKDFIWR